MSDVILDGRNVTKEFDGLVAVDDVDFQLERGHIYSLIGPNGAGKTTLFNLITGYLDPTEGEIKFEGTDITMTDPADVNDLGIARTFQLVQPFEGMSVYDNVRVGALFGADDVDPDEATRDALELTNLWAQRDEQSRNLPIEGTKLLEIAKAVATQPDLLLVDEPAAGLNVTETEQVLDILRTLAAQGITIWLVEHDMDAVTDVSDTIFVLDGGKKIAEGPPADVANDERVIEAYMGSDYDASELLDEGGDADGTA
jgi:ABC-type branched-subunit amino acid transport system ATPase component